MEPKKNEKEDKNPPILVVLTEGKTELDYMDEFSRGYQRQFKYIPYDRDNFDIDMTNKEDMLNLLESKVKYMQGHVTPFCYAT